MQRIKLTRGKYAIVNNRDYSWLIKFNWRAIPSQHWHGLRWYAGTGANTKLMHRMILLAPKGTQVDHKNMNGLDNRRGNLRLATRGQQRANSGRSRPGISKFKGVSWCSRDQHWRAKLEKNGHSYARYSIDEETAAHLYNEMALLHFGKYARINRGLTKKPLPPWTHKRKGTNGYSPRS